MKKLIVAAALAAAAPAAVARADVPDADPAMWVVNDEDTTIYLFGTFHMLDGKRDWFNDEVKAAFDASQEVVLEARLPERAADLRSLLVKYGVDRSGKTLSSRLPPEMKAKLDQVLGSAGLPAKAFDALEPWFASMALSQVATQKLGLKGEHGPEVVLSRAARERGIPVSELEGMEFQLRLFDKMPEAQQIAVFGQALDSIGDGGESMKPMLAAWSAGDTEALVKSLEESLNHDSDLYDLIFTNRNRHWASWVKHRLDRPGTVFVAVGAGHLAGRNSVQELLAEHGIKAARVAGQ